MKEAKRSGKVRYIGFTGHRTPSAHRRVLEVTDHFYTCQMPINAADPIYESFVKNILAVLAAKNLGVLAMKTLADRGFFGTNRWDSRPTAVSALIPNRISVQEAIHFVWSLPVSVLIPVPNPSINSAKRSGLHIPSEECHRRNASESSESRRPSR